MINSETGLCGVIGNPVRHTLSPVMHNAAILHLGLNYVYLAFQVDSGGLGNAISGMRSLGIRGLNVTIPHKVAVLPFLDELDDMAMSIGAVNTIVNDNGKLKGYNTDAAGFLHSLMATDFSPRERQVVLLGAGGAARAVGFALAKNGAHITILNRQSEIGQAVLLAQHLSYEAVTEVKALALDEANLKKVMRSANLLVNATSLGMSPETDGTPVPSRLLKKDTIVFDIVYSPLETRLLREASACGCRTVSGLEMLVRQGALALELWTGCQAPVDVMRSAVLSALCPRTKEKKHTGNKPLSKKDSIALIGFMGAGKSSIGRMLAKTLSMPFIDIDKNIEKKAGKSIERIFAEDGEPEFRKMETLATAEAACKNGCIIACGGGVVLNHDNIKTLKKNAVVIFLDIAPEAAVKRLASGKTKRPLLAGGDISATIKKLMRSRRPLYEEAADIKVDTSKLSIKAAAERIIERLGEYEAFRF